MTESTATISCRYYLTLPEAQEGFALATFGKKKVTRFISPVISIVIILWGISLGMTGIGKVYVMIGVSFLLLHLLMRFVFLPRMFKRQYEQHRFGEVEQGIDLYQGYAVLFAAGREQQFNYADIAKFVVGKVSYMLELKDKTVIILSKDAVIKTGQQSLFESTLQAR